jgi:hypothetical protein
MPIDDVDVDATDFFLIADEGGTVPTRLRRIPFETVSAALAAGPAMQAEFGGGGGGAMSAAAILAALITVDGTGSGLDADLLDGNSSAAFATAAHTHAGVYQPLDADLTALAGAGNSAVLVATDVAFTTAKDSKLAGIEALATADQTAAEILAALLTVDGPASGLDADLLDGQHAAAFAVSGHTHAGVYQPLDGDLTALATAGNSTVLAATTASYTTAEQSKLAGIEALATADQTAAEILAALLTVDGSGSGLDADLLDGNSSAAFALSGHNHTGVYQPLDADLTALAAAGNSAVLGATTASFLTADETKLDGIEAGAQVRSWDNALADDTVSGITTTFTAAAGGVVFGNCCYIDGSGTLALADADALATSAVVAVATATIAGAASGVFLLRGIIRDDSANAFTPGGLIYLSTTAGGYTQTAPSGVDDVINVLGVAINADKWYFNPSMVMVEHT